MGRYLVSTVPLLLGARKVARSDISHSHTEYRSTYGSRTVRAATWSDVNSMCKRPSPLALARRNRGGGAFDLRRRPRTDAHGRYLHGTNTRPHVANSSATDSSKHAIPARVKTVSRRAWYVTRAFRHAKSGASRRANRGTIATLASANKSARQWRASRRDMTV